MGEYISNYVIDPLARQARRLSQLSHNNLNESLVLAESFSRWAPGHLFSGSPPTEDDREDEEDRSENHDEQPGAGHQWIRFWRQQTQTALMHSPPLDPLQDDIHDDSERPKNQDEDEEPLFPVLESEMPSDPEQTPPTSELPRLSVNEQSLNPLQDLSEQSQIHEADVRRSYSVSDPTSRPGGEQGTTTTREGIGEDTTLRLHDGSTMLPEDDGMSGLRDKIKAVWHSEGSSSDKSRQIHILMMEKYNTSQSNVNRSVGTRSNRNSAMIENPPTPPQSSPKVGPIDLAASPRSVQTGTETFQLLPFDMERTYAPNPPPENTKEDLASDQIDDEPIEEPPLRLGCKHYVRSAKPQCDICLRFYPCRLCHDEDVKDHVLPRHSTKNMLCMHCLTPQPAGQWCKNCNECLGTYYCTICKLWNNDSEKSIYHCDDCGICRLGQGLGKDFYHCPICAVCISITVASTHRCIERSTKCDCPICGDYMFTSPETVVFMRCGHSIHESCFKDWCKTAYKCPICSKSVVNMETQFRRLDRHIASQPMPEEYRDSKSLVNCNDCHNKSLVPFHWLGLKCDHCEGYNTTQLEFFGGPPPNEQSRELEADPLTPNADSAGEALATAMAQRVESLSHTPRSRPTTAISDVAGRSASPWLIPNRHGARSASPTVSNYFGFDQRDERSSNRVDDGEEGLNFWGIHSPRSFEGLWRRTARSDSDENDGSDSEDSTPEADVVDDEEDEDDALSLLGHR